MAGPGMRLESGWQTWDSRDGSNCGDPIPSAISFLSTSQSQLGGFQTLSSLKFDSLDTQTGGRKTLQSLPCPQLCSATRAIMEESSIMNREKSRLVG